MIKLNIGCGPNGQFDGFINIDNSPSIIISKFKLVKYFAYKSGIISKTQYQDNWKNIKKCDATKKIPFKRNSVDLIYSSHFLEHNSFKDGQNFLKECYRVLKNRGVLRIVVPDLVFHSKKYLEETKFLLKNPTTTDISAHNNFIKTVYGGYLVNKRKGAEHLYMYDTISLRNALINAGFQKVAKHKFKSGNSELSKFDNREIDSIHFEAHKIF